MSISNFQLIVSSQYSRTIYKHKSKSGLNIKRETDSRPYDSLTSFALYYVTCSLAFL